jgi:hypothetical protein
MRERERERERHGDRERDETRRDEGGWKGGREDASLVTCGAGAGAGAAGEVTAAGREVAQTSLSAGYYPVHSATQIRTFG